MTLSPIPGREEAFHIHEALMRNLVSAFHRTVLISCLCMKNRVHISRLDDRITVYPADVVLFEGILVFYPQKVRDMFHMKLFVDTDSDVRLSRRGILCLLHA